MSLKCGGTNIPTHTPNQMKAKLSYQYNRQVSNHIFQILYLNSNEEIDAKFIIIIQGLKQSNEKNTSELI